MAAGVGIGFETIRPVVGGGRQSRHGPGESEQASSHAATPSAATTTPALTTLIRLRSMGPPGCR